MIRDFLARIAARYLNRLARERKARGIRETTNAMRAHLGLPGRV
jgi:hypothetical protein